jgi:hypothetical protein
MAADATVGIDVMIAVSMATGIATAATVPAPMC